MLISLSIRNFLLIDSLDLDLYQGFSAFTGETGAGKSVFLDAILFCLGGKFDSSIMRSVDIDAVVTLIIKPTPEVAQYLNDHEIKVGDEVIIKRVQQANNRKKFFIDNALVAQKIVTDLQSMLLDFHGQNLHNYLSDPATHLDILDSFGQLTALREHVAEKYQELRMLEKNLADILANLAKIEREADYLHHVIAELDKLNVQEGEEDYLSDLRSKLMNHEKDVQAINNALEIIEEHSIYTALLALDKKIAKCEGDSFVQAQEKVNEALSLIEEIEQILSVAKTNKYDNLPDENIEAVEERLFNLRNIARKHKKQVAELPEFLQECQQQLSGLEFKLDNKVAFEHNIAKVKAEYISLAKDLHEQRQVQAMMLEKMIHEELAKLHMASAKFSIEIAYAPENFSIKGSDEVRFVAATNPGMQTGSIDKIASGGELSRFMLAVKVALFDTSFRPIMIFDEIDTGLGGKIASSIGNRLKKLGEITQVLAISHQPQVAAIADYHYVVSKKQLVDSSYSTIELMNMEGREYEIARMISAEKITETSIQAAKDLIEVV